MKYSLILLTFGVFFSSCGFNASKYYVPTEVNASEINVPLANLKAGKTALINKCNECHRLYAPSKYSNSEWSGWLNKMQERANVSDTEKANILSYLSAEIME